MTMIQIKQEKLGARFELFPLPLGHAELAGDLHDYCADARTFGRYLPCCFEVVRANLTHNQMIKRANAVEEAQHGKKGE